MKAIEMSRRNKEQKSSLLAVAADSLVHFTDGYTRVYRDSVGSDGIVEAEVARMAYMCLPQAAC
ncbi:MAG: hypothetical protein IKH18_09555 [Clostridia bacterium]|nr:hypothetical protein [Clostridia bacterium]